MKKAGGTTPSANRITLLRDADGDGTAELRTPYVTGLASPFGMALVDTTLYIANADALVAYPYVEGGVPTGTPLDILTDFLDSNGKARGRPVGVAIAKDGALLVADDVGNRIWRVSAPAGTHPASLGTTPPPEGNTPQ